MFRYSNWEKYPINQMMDTVKGTYRQDDNGPSERFWRDLESVSVTNKIHQSGRVRVAVLDGPVDFKHPCFEGAVLEAVPGPCPHQINDGPACEHGTFVASILFGQPESAIRGVTPSSHGLIVPIFKDDAFGRLEPCSQQSMAVAIRVALEHGAQIINISGGEYEPDATPSPQLEAALEDCARRGVVVVAAVGNEGCACPHIPAAVPTVVAVGAMDHSGVPMLRSNWGAQFDDHGILAPGENIKGAKPLGGINYRSGTSFATALVSGTIAELASAAATAGLDGPEPRTETDDPTVSDHLTTSAVAALLANTQQETDEFLTEFAGRLFQGRINVIAALSALGLQERRNEDMSQTSGQEPNTDESTVAPVAEPSKQALPAISVSAAPAVCEECEAVMNTSSDKHDPGQWDGDVSEISQNVFALGSLGYEFNDASRRESFVQLGLSNPDDPKATLKFLNDNPYFADRILWTLNIGSTPIYVVRPSGAFASETYAKIREMLASQVAGKSDRSSVPGILGGNAILQGSRRIPFLLPDVRGMFSWTTDNFIDDVTKADPNAKKKKIRDSFKNFLERIYYELRNTGVKGADRALNYAATNAFAIHSVFAEAMADGMELNSINVEPTPVAPPDTECYDVILEFFNPKNRTEHAKKVFRFSIDVSDVLPVLVDQPKSWSVY